MKKLGLVMMLMVFLLVFPKVGEADSSGAAIYLDGEQLSLASDVQVANIKGNVMIPIRVVSENLGFDVKWDKANLSVTVKNSEKLVRMVVNSLQAELNGEAVELNLAPVLKSNTTLVPLRFVSEQMGLDVKWDNQKKAVFLTSSIPPAPDVEIDPEHGENPDNVPTTPPVAGQSSLTGISFNSNQLMIATEGNVVPNIFSVAGPERIVIDLPNTVFSEQFLMGHALNVQSSGEIAVADYPDVTRIRYALFSENPSTIRIVLDLTASKHYQVTNENGLTTIDLNATGEDVTTPPLVPPVSGGGKKTVVIDAGHGGSQPGAVSPSGKQEKVLNLSIALKVEALLRKESNINVVMTRNDDATLGLSDRVKVANSINADIFVSIHGNSSTSSSPNGTETYYTRDASKPLANVIHKHLAKATGLADRGVKYSSLHVTRETKMPAVLLEIGFLSNKGDEAQLFKDEFQNRVAQGIVAGIKEYLKVP
ncbi:hypothetical protein JCM10914A_40150 [Paenibacillus sp. JCM 10914]|uniref:N-acetylmuramoyl-L-alanine amidase family protein n=1 Tax=Paenibacillus sp. JCM 10914 TaxID=1236974 RepID=UPI0003CC5A9D|nr:N-acetylmuramoyl-L-alanine amidase family protein [Paenibacillus sp. JCM 10914]GAE04742.1 N-acetylmuramoyl-L-alanine amidase [Paenibacillus sp. JCM 10914]